MGSSALALINVSRWQEKVRAMFGLRGGNPIPTIEELLPVVVVENDRPEYGFAGRETLWGGTTSVGAAVGNFSRVGISNPVDSGVLVVVQRVSIAAAVAGRYVCSLVANVSISPTATLNLRPRDGRVFPNVAAAKLATNNDNAFSTSPNFWEANVPAASTFVIQEEYILPPGFNLWVSHVVANTATEQIGFALRERPLERGLPS